MGEEDVLRASGLRKMQKLLRCTWTQSIMSLTREELRAYVKKQGIESRVDIPKTVRRWRSDVNHMALNDVAS